MNGFFFGLFGAAAIAFVVFGVVELRAGETRRAVISFALAVVEAVAAATIAGGA